MIRKIEKENRLADINDKFEGGLMLRKQSDIAASLFTDSGRQILFNGLNVLCRDPQMGYCYPGFADALPWFRRVDLT